MGNLKELSKTTYTALNSLNDNWAGNYSTILDSLNSSINTIKIDSSETDPKAKENYDKLKDIINVFNGLYQNLLIAEKLSFTLKNFTDNL